MIVILKTTNIDPLPLPPLNKNDECLLSNPFWYDCLTDMNMHFTEKETKCPSSGEEITQLVFGVYKSNSYNKPCSHLVTMETWDSGLMLPVKATIDGLKDKDKEREVRVFVTMAVQSVVFYTQQISTVEVSFFLFVCFCFYKWM